MNQSNSFPSAYLIATGIINQKRTDHKTSASMLYFMIERKVPEIRT